MCYVNGPRCTADTLPPLETAQKRFDKSPTDRNFDRLLTRQANYDEALRLNPERRKALYAEGIALGQTDPKAGMALIIEANGLEAERTALIKASNGQKMSKAELQDEASDFNKDIPAIVQNELVEEVPEEPVTSPPSADVSKDESPTVGEAVAGNEASAMSTIEDLSLDGDSGVRESVAENISTSQEVLENLSKDEDRGVRQAVANNYSSSQATLATLATDENQWVRAAVGRNTSASQETLTALSTAENWDTRYAVAENTSASEALLEKLSNDDDPMVIEGVAGNKSATLPMLAEMTRSPREAVSKKAWEGIHTRFGRAGLLAHLGWKAEDYDSYSDSTLVKAI